MLVLPLPFGPTSRISAFGNIERNALSAQAAEGELDIPTAQQAVALISLPGAPIFSRLSVTSEHAVMRPVDRRIQRADRHRQRITGID
jgi:hypothetical protein